jgi:peroxiredoxin
MAVETVVVSKGRSLTLAGFSLLLLVGATSIEAADSSSQRTALRDLAGKRVDLSAPDKGVTALVFYSAECPISNSYSPMLATLMESFPAKSVKWVGVCVDPDLTDSEVQTHARDFSLRFQVVRDRKGTFARKLGAKMTPEAFVIDTGGKVRYHGRIDDQFAARRKRNANPSESELKQAIAAVLNGKEVTAPYAEPVGCADLCEGRGGNPAEELPGMPSPGPGGPVRTGNIRTGTQTSKRHRLGGRGPCDAALESRW